MNAAKRLVVLLAGGSIAEPGPALLAFRYAATAAALDLAVELHIVGRAVEWLRKPVAPGGASPAAADASIDGLRSQIRELKAHGVELYACSAALAGAGMATTDLIDEVDGVRGAAALLAAGLGADARLLSF